MNHMLPHLELPKWTIAEDSLGQMDAARLLGDTQKFTSVILQHVLGLSPAEFAQRLRSPTGPGGQWLLSVMDGGKEGCQVWLNYFHESSFSRLFELGHIVPHRHQRSFATRLLSGSYVQWKYRVEDNSRLRFAEQTVSRAGDVYTCGHRDVHLVLRPSTRCLSLAIRGPEMYSSPPKRLPSLPFTVDFEEMRREIIEVIEGRIGAA